MNRYSWPWRAALTILFGALLALRLLSPPGFMPSFDHGSVAIVVCPDASGASTPMALHHHHHGDAKLQQHCPYAAGGSPAAAAELPLIAAMLLVTAALEPAGKSFAFLDFRRFRDRPPLRGPPLFA